jgi:hypothetical protein
LTSQPWVLPSVEEACKRLAARVRTDTEEYAPVAGNTSVVALQFVVMTLQRGCPVTTFPVDSYNPGDPKFVNAALKFAYGADSSALKDGRIAGAQALSGTGALRIGFEFLRRFLGKDAHVYVPSPTWPNHCNIIRVTSIVPACSLVFGDVLFVMAGFRPFLPVLSVDTFCYECVVPCIGEGWVVDAGI